MIELQDKRLQMRGKLGMLGKKTLAFWLAKEGSQIGQISG